jgi:hypothetical protein
MSLKISKGLTLRKGWQPMDPDAAAYITAVETADGQALEEKTKIAIDNFVLGCKADGIWDAIKASCILAGARTLTGALVPLVGTAPTSFNFVSGDYNRKTGLVGDGSTKYLNANRNNNADPQDSQHLSVFATTVGTSNNGAWIGSFEGTGEGSSYMYRATGGVGFRVVSRRTGPEETKTGLAAGLIGISRSSSSSFTARSAGSSAAISMASSASAAQSINVFRLSRASSPYLYINSRLAFYSIGESLDLALLDARVTDLINAFGAAIP